MSEPFFTSERLSYRPYAPEDLQALHAQFNEPSRRRWFYFQEPDCLTVEFARRMIRESIANCAKPDLLAKPLALAVNLRETGEMIGGISLSKFHGPEEELEDVEVGWRICEAHQNKGYATEAAKAAIPWAFDHLRGRGARLRLISDIEHENWPSRRVAEKAGMTVARVERYITVYEIFGKAQED